MPNRRRNQENNGQQKVAHKITCTIIFISLLRDCVCMCVWMGGGECEFECERVSLRIYTYAHHLIESRSEGTREASGEGRVGGGWRGEGVKWLPR